MAKKRRETKMFKLGVALFGTLAVLSLFLNFMVVDSSLGTLFDNSITGFEFINKEQGSTAANDQIQIYLICFLAVAIVVSVFALLSLTSLKKLKNKTFGLIATVLGVGLVILAVLVISKIDTGSIGQAQIVAVSYGLGVFAHLAAAIGVFAVGLLAIVKSK